MSRCPRVELTPGLLLEPPSMSQVRSSGKITRITSPWPTLNILTSSEECSKAFLRWELGRASLASFSRALRYISVVCRLEAA